MVLKILNKSKDIYLKEYEKNPISTLFITIMLGFFVTFIVAAIITGGKSVYNVLITDHNDVFMDYFNSIMYSADRPYSYWKVIYPPLVTTFYAVIGHFTIPFVEVGAGERLSFVLRESQMGMMSFLLITLVSFYVLHKILSKLLKDKGAVLHAELLILLLFFSYPLIYALERGNSIVLVLIFCFIFLMGYKSENKRIRLISYIALGCAAGFKLYPAILGLLIIRERRWKEAAICGIIGATLVLVPFIFTDGTITMLLDQIMSYTSRLSSSNGFLNLDQFIFFIFSPFISHESISIISKAVVGTVTLLSFLIVIFDRKMKFWKIVTLLACNLAIGPGVATTYLAVYMMIPITYFLMAEKELTKNNLFYMACFIIIMALFVGFDITFTEPQVMIRSIKASFIIIATFALISEGVKHLHDEYIKNRKKPSSIEIYNEI